MRRALAALVVALGGLALVTVAAAWRAADLQRVAPTVQLRDRHGAFLGEVSAGEALGFWPLDAVPPRVAAATLALEDRRFASHPGVDPLAVARAVRQNLRAGERVSGASTLAMQVARLQGGPGPRTWRRKAFEALTALMLVDRQGRDAVLRQYLTLAPYGNNVHGIAYAARRYFDKPVQDLSWAETALLCAVPQAPADSDLYDARGRARAVARGERILGQLLLRGELDDVAYTGAVRELRALRPLERPVRPSSTLHPVLALGPSLAGAGDPLVATSLDLGLQGRVQAVLRDAVLGWEGRGAGNAAAVVVDLATLQVLADVGSVDYHDEARSGAIDFTRTERYPGSTLKPFLYGMAVDRGVIDPGAVLDDLGRGPDGIGNADGRFLGPMLPRRALATSRNVPALSLVRQVGLDELYALFARLDLHDDSLPAAHYGIGVAIGGMPTTPLQLATAWGAIATDGRLRPLQWTAEAPRPAGVPILDEGTVRWLALALSDPMARLPVFPRMGHGEVPFPAAFKTGTSPDHRDAWAVAFTDAYLVVVWVGHPDWRPMDGLSGYRAGSRLAREILLLLHPDRAQGLADGSFPPPDGWTAAQVCPLTGQVAGTACGGTFREWFPPGRAPVTPCAAHRIEGGRAVVDLPARYAAWQRAAGLPTGGAAPQTGAPVRLTVVSPASGAELSPDPEAPPTWSTLRLVVAVEPPVDQVVWYVDGAPFAVVEAPYEARWPLAPGAHTFEAGVPYRPERSDPVTVTVF